MTYFIIGYTIILFVILGYTMFLHKQQHKLELELSVLEEMVAKKTAE